MSAAAVSGSHPQTACRFVSVTHANRRLLFYAACGPRAYCGHATVVILCSDCLILTVDSEWTRLGEMHDPSTGLLGAGH